MHKVQPGWLRQEQGTFALCPGCCWVSFLPEWLVITGCSCPLFQGVVRPSGESKPWHFSSGLFVLSVFTAGWAGPWLAFSNRLSSSLFSSKQVEIKTLVHLYTPLWKRTVIEIDLMFLGLISELVLRGYNVLVSPKSHLSEWIKHNKTTPNQKPEFLICKSLQRILAFYCFPINKMQEIVLNASPQQLPIIYHIKCPFF